MSVNLKRLVAGVVVAGTLALTGCQDKPTTTGGSAAAGGKAYPLDVCLVSGEKLGSMGEPVVFQHEGQEVKLCCKSCKPDFEKEPAKFIAKLAGK
jgi:hypothetical protein